MRNIFTILLLLLIVAPMQMRAQTDAEQVIRIGRNVLSMEDYILAIQYFNQAIKAKPYLSEPYFFRALAKLNLEDYKGAKDDCTLAIERNRYRAESYKLRGFAMQNLGEDSLAVIDYNIGLQYYPEDKYFLYYKAVALSELKKYDEADSTFSKLMRLHPSFEEGFEARARLYLMKGDTVACLKNINRAVATSPNLINARLMRAEIESNRKNWAAALEDMDEVIKLQPQSADLYLNRAYLRYNNDDFFGAMSDYNYTLQLQPDYTAALFNRALLRYEVKDLNRAAEDFSAVLKLDPDNFHAIFNRALIYLETKKYNNAIADFQKIAKRYPTFYPVYYGIAEARQAQGNIREAIANVNHAESLIRKYVKNPVKNPLQRPTIEAGKKNQKNTNKEDEPETEIDVMNKFNQLVTVNNDSESRMAYNDKIKGQLQNRNVKVEQEPFYIFSFSESKTALKINNNYFRELDDINSGRLIPHNIYLSNIRTALSDASESEKLFDLIDSYIKKERENKIRPVDLIDRSVAYLVIKNYDESIKDMDKVIADNSNFTVAYMIRAAARYERLKNHSEIEPASGKSSAANKIPFNERAEISLILSDLDKSINLNPRLIFAWFNKGCIYLDENDLTSALQCFTNAIEINKDFGEAYYNRGLIYLKIGNKQKAFADLSKAGELGILPSYNLLKRMK